MGGCLCRFAGDARDVRRTGGAVVVKPSANILFTAAVGALAVIHVVFPKLAIDSVTISLLLVAAIPWLGRFVKTLELERVGKVEFRDVQRIEKQAAAADLVAPDQAPNPEAAKDLENVADPNLALAGIRLALERKLLELADAAGLKTTRRGVYLLAELEGVDAIFSPEFFVFRNFFSLLNSAVHGATVDRAAADKALTMGRNLLESLDERIKLVRARRAK